MIAPDMLHSDAIVFGTLADAALEVIVKVTLLLGVALVATMLLRRASAAVRHHVWLLAIAGSLLVPLLAFAPGVVVRIPANWMPVQVTAAPTMATSATVPATDSNERATESLPSQPIWLVRPQSRNLIRASAQMNANIGELLPPVRSAQVVTFNDGRTESFDVRVPPDPVPISTVEQKEATAVHPDALVALLWLAGACSLLAWRLIGYVLLARLIRHSTPITDVSWHDSFRLIVADFGIRRDVRLLSHRAFRTPVTAGWRRPVIVLPADIGVSSRERQEAVLAHELAHIRRGDFVTQGFAAIATAVFWFHPLVWFAAIRLRAESECAADDNVLMHGLKAENYARHLLALAGRTTLADPLPVVGMARVSQLEQRLRAMLAASASRAELSGRAQRLLGAASLVVVVPYASLRVSLIAPLVVPVAISDQQQPKPHVPTQPISKRSDTVAANYRASVAEAREVLQSSAAAIAKLVGATPDSDRRAEPGRRHTLSVMDGVLLDPTADDAYALTRSQSTQADTVIEQTIPMSSGELLTLTLQSGANVFVRGWDEPTAKMRARLGGLAWRQAHAHVSRGKDGVGVASVSEREGYKVSQFSPTNGYVYSSVAGTLKDLPSVDHLIEVWVPRRTNIKLHSSLGNVTIQDVDGDLSGDIKTGNLEINSVRGTVDLGTELGDVRILNSLLRGFATTQCGTVSLAGVTGGVSATSRFDPASYKDTERIIVVDGIVLGETCSPRLSRFADLPNRVRENNPYGDIVLDSAPNGGVLMTGRGSITVRASGGHISAVNSKGNIELSNVRGDATARSRSGNITIRLVNTNGAEHHINARTTNGIVTIEIPDELDARIEADVLASDSARAKGRYSNIIDQYGFGPNFEQTRGGGMGALTASVGATRGRGTGRIYVHVTDGDIIFTRAKK